MTEKENPYLKMDAAVLNEHLAQVKEVMDVNKLSTLQYFGEAITTDNQNKIAEHASLTTKVDKLEEAATAGKLSENDIRIVKRSMDSVVSEIQSIDENFPIQGILDSGLSAFQKLDMLDQAKVGVIYVHDAIEAVRKEFGQTGKSIQGFGEAPAISGDEADSIVNKLIEESGVKVE